MLPAFAVTGAILLLLLPIACANMLTVLQLVGVPCATTQPAIALPSVRTRAATAAHQCKYAVLVDIGSLFPLCCACAGHVLVDQGRRPAGGGLG